MARDAEEPEVAPEVLVPSLARGALVGLAVWAGVGALPAVIAWPAATAAGALERWGIRGGWRRAAAVLLTAPVVAGLAFAMAYQGLYAHMSRHGFGEAREAVIEALQWFPEDPVPSNTVLVREWLVKLPWWRASDDPTWCVLATASLLAVLFTLLAAGRLLLVPRRVELQARMPGLVLLGSTVSACAVGLVWSAWLLPAPPPNEPGLQGLTLWGFAVLIGMVAPLAYGLTDLFWPPGGSESQLD